MVHRSIPLEGAYIEIDTEMKQKKESRLSNVRANVVK